MSPELAEKVRMRLRQKSVVNGNCLLWTGGINSNGYGVMSICNRSVSVHKAAYEAYIGDIPDGAWVGHTCEYRQCVNPGHLYLRARGLAERFWDKVIVIHGGCWKWTGDKEPFGYGRLQSHRGTEGVLVAHRVSWEIHNGPIPDGLFVLHKCDNPECTNPEHLFLGTNADNMADKTAKGRQHKGEDHPAAILKENDILRIVAMNRTGIRKVDIARTLGVSQSTVYCVLKGSSWKHVTSNIDDRFRIREADLW